MDPQERDSAEEVKRLQRCINDLISLVALPAIWSTSEPEQIVHMLVDALVRMLKLDFVFARLKGSVAASPIDVLRVATSFKVKEPGGDPGRTIRDWMEGQEAAAPPARKRFEEEGITIFPIPLGVNNEIGMVLAGSERADFPTETESLLLRMAANQASVGLREAMLLMEQKRMVDELDRRVAERTAALARANEDLKKEIEERRSAEEKLRVAHAQVVRSEERWRSVFENSAIGVALADLTGRFIATNPVYQRMLGYTDEELRRLTFLDITREEDVEENRTLIGELLEGRRQFQIEKQYRRKDGQLVWVRNHISIVPGTERAPRFLMALSEDITQRIRSEEALARARSELARVSSITSLGVLTASIAHEVNQPLSGIITNASTCMRMLSADPPNIEGARETVRRTIRDGNRAADVISRLRTLYSKKEPTSEAVDLNESTREVITLSLSELQRNGVIVRLDLAEDVPSIAGDGIRLQQVILNLVRNASDAMSTVDDRPRELVIKTERAESDHVRLSVKDTGIGLTPEAADKIFDAFYTTKSDGMGIGLSISRSIIEAHQGRLSAKPNVGPGATFSFVVPRGSEGPGNPETGANKPGPPNDAA